MTADEYETLGQLGILGEKIEFLDGRIFCGDHEFIFSRDQADAAARAGITVRSCIDAALEDPAARAELAARLGQS